MSGSKPRTSTGRLPRGSNIVDLAKTGVVIPASRTKRQQAVASGLQLGFPHEKSSESDYGDPMAETQMIVTIDELRTYEGNPRRSAPNPQYNEIKDSIRSSGLHNQLSITRRPGESFFIIEAGGNTRLQVLRELWTETGEDRFYRLSVMFKPWKKESTVLAKHLVENNVRGDMTFWDNANGFMDLKSLLEVESGQSISLRQFEEVLREQGVVCNKSDLAKFGFAVNYLKYLGAALPHLPSRSVTEIQPRLNLFKRFAEKHSDISEATLYEEVLAPVMASYGENFTATNESGKKAPFDAEELMLLCEEALAIRCAVDKKRLQQVLDGLRKAPDSSIEELLQKASKPETPEIPQEPEVEVEEASEKRRTTKKEAGAQSSAVAPVVAGGEAENASPEEVGESHEPEGVIGATDAIAPMDDDELLPAILQDVRFFAEQVDISNALRFDDSLSFGFWVDMVPLDPGADALRHIGWWVLCTLSGQLHGEFASKLPDDATWRNVMENDQQAVDHTLGGLPDFLHFHQIWALEGFTPGIFEAYLRLLGTMRRFKGVAPERFDDATGGIEP